MPNGSLKGMLNIDEISLVATKLMKIQRHVWNKYHTHDKLTQARHSNQIKYI